MRTAVRSLARHPGFAIVAILTLALGIGATTAVFAVLNSVVLRALPYRDAAQLAVIWEQRKAEGTRINGVTVADFLDWQSRSRTFASFTGHDLAAFNLAGDGRPERVTAVFATADFLETYGVAPAMGRGFRPDDVKQDDVEQDRNVALITDALWERRFARSNAAIGATLRLDGTPYQVIGVMPRGFTVFFGAPADLFLPLHFDARRSADRGAHDLLVVARLKPGATFAEAATDMAAVSAQIEREHPLENTGHSANVMSLDQQVRGEAKPAIVALAGAVLLVLLIACGNVASLLTARATERRREIAVRRALGASQLALLRMLAGESLLLAIAGGVLGVAAASGCLAALRQLLPRTIGVVTIPGIDQVAIDPRVLGFALAVACASALIFGFAPVWTLLRSSLHSGSRTSFGATANRVRGWLVAGEVGLATMLLACALLLGVSFAKLAARPLGFEVPGRLLAEMSLSPNRYLQGDAQVRFADRLMERVAAIPGDEAAAITTDVPATTDMSRVGFQVEGRAEPRNLEEWPKGHHRRVSWNYTQVMGVPILRGRGFTPQDKAAAPLVVLVNRTAAETYWPGIDPIGKRIALPFSKDWRTVVGVTGDIRHQGLARGSAPEIYFPFSQWAQPRISVTLIAKTRGDPMRLAEPLRREIAGIDPDLPVSGISTIESRVEKMAAQPRFSSRLFEVLAGIALLLAVTGLYSVLAYLVSRRTAEFGLRMALGASPGRLLRGVLNDGLRWTLAGAAMGAAAALAAGRAIQPLLFGISATNPWVYAAAAGVLVPAAILACLAPAVRASRVDPAAALRAE